MQHIFSIRFIALVFFGLILTGSVPSAIHAQEAVTQTDAPLLSEQECARMLGVPELGIIRDVDRRLLLNPEVCSAYAYLISRYTPGPSSSMGLSNPQAEGILKLNQQFAVNLYRMLRAADSVGLTIRIISAYRTCEAQMSANPTGWGGDCHGSLHTLGRAVDFAWSKASCTSRECQFVQSYTASGGSCMAFYNDAHAFVSGEANHVEDTCNSVRPLSVEDVIGNIDLGLPEEILDSLGGGGIGSQVTDILGGIISGHGEESINTGLENLFGSVFGTIFGEIPPFGESTVPPPVSQEAPHTGEVIVVSEDGTVIARSDVSVEDALAQAAVFFNSSTISSSNQSSLGSGLLGTLFPRVSNNQPGTGGLFGNIFGQGTGNTFDQPQVGTTTDTSPPSNAGNGGFQLIQMFVQTIFGILGNILGSIGFGR